MGAVFRIRQQKVLLDACAGIELHQPVRIPAVREPDVAVMVEADVLPHPAAAIADVDVFRRLAPLARGIGRQVVLDIHRLAERRLIDRRVAIRANPARLGVRPVILRHVGQQLRAVLPGER